MPRNRDKLSRDEARAARRTPSVAEAIMWQELRNGKTGFKFRREHPIDRYRLDFFCAEAMLAVEMDGEQHNPDQDAIRDSVLATFGILTYRVKNRSYLGIDPGPYVHELREIVSLCEARSGRNSGDSDPSPPTPSPPEGRGGSLN